MPIRLSSSVPKAPITITGKWLSTCCSTSLVKCRPMPLATSHWPVLRPPGSSLKARLARQRTTITANNEPTIHGKGQSARLAR